MKMLLPALLLSFATSLIALRFLLSPALRDIAVDRPNERSLHQGVVPRTGGLAILAGVSAGLCLTRDALTLSLWGVALALAVVSFADDRYDLPAWVRFLVQLATALSALALIEAGQAWWWCGLAVLSTVWMTNLYNFMDGSDGLAGGMGAVGFGAYAIGMALGGAQPAAILCACTAIGCLGFLTRNYPPATIFMGDVGSTVLGFLAAIVGLYGNARGVWPLWFPALVFLPFALDATVTLLRRGMRREKVWQAHREHYYQRLIRRGWTHRRMAKVAHALMFACAACAVLVLELRPALGWMVLAVWLLVLGAVMRKVDRIAPSTPTAAVLGGA